MGNLYYSPVLKLASRIDEHVMSGHVENLVSLPTFALIECNFALFDDEFFYKIVEYMSVIPQVPH